MKFYATLALLIALCGFLVQAQVKDQIKESCKKPVEEYFTCRTKAVKKENEVLDNIDACIGTCPNPKEGRIQGENRDNVATFYSCIEGVQARAKLACAKDLALPFEVPDFAFFPANPDKAPVLGQVFKSRSEEGRRHGLVLGAQISLAMGFAQLRQAQLELRSGLKSDQLPLRLRKHCESADLEEEEVKKCGTEAIQPFADRIDIVAGVNFTTPEIRLCRNSLYGGECWEDLAWLRGALCDCMEEKMDFTVCAGPGTGIELPKDYEPKTKLKLVGNEIPKTVMGRLTNRLCRDQCNWSE